MLEYFHMHRFTSNYKTQDFQHYKSHTVSPKQTLNSRKSKLPKKTQEMENLKMKVAILMLISMVGLIEGIDCNAYCREKCGQAEGAFDCLIACLGQCTRSPPPNSSQFNKITAKFYFVGK